MAAVRKLAVGLEMLLAPHSYLFDHGFLRIGRMMRTTFLLAVCIASDMVLAGPYKAVDLGAGTTAYALNDSGQVVGYSYGFDLQYPKAFLYSNGVMQNLGALTGFASVAYGINNAGDVVGHFNSLTSTHAFGYLGGVMSDLGTLGGPSSSALDINSSGAIVGWSNTSPMSGSGYNGFLFQGGQMTDIGSLNGQSGYTLAEAINDKGQIVGVSRAQNENHAFMYDDGTMTDLGTLGGGYSDAVGINNIGQIVGASAVIGSLGIEQHAFLFDSGVMHDLGSFNALLDTVAFDINDSGQIVGTSDGRAFLYEQGLMKDVNTLLASPIGTQLRYARAINASGQFIAAGANGHSYLLSAAPVPEPSTYALVLAGLGLLAAARRRVVS